MASKGPEMRILSLDGGGFRGLSSLLILQSIMDRIENSAKGTKGQPAVEARPCDYFEYITGTGIGGVIALLLGRLQFTVSKCMLAYRHLSLVLQDGGYSPLFDMDKLLEVAERIAGYYEHKTGQTGTAETLVFAVEKGNAPQCIYSVDMELSSLDPHTPIQELIAALMATKGLFREYTTERNDGRGVTFLDNAYPVGYSNPTREVVQAILARELRKTSDSAPLSRDAILVSVGTGQVAQEDVGDLALLGCAHGLSLLDIAKPWKFWHMAQDAAGLGSAIALPVTTIRTIERTQADALRDAVQLYESSHMGRCHYRRFEIHPVADVGPCDFRSVKEVGDVTDAYLEHVKRELEALVKIIVSGRKV